MKEYVITLDTMIKGRKVKGGTTMQLSDEDAKRLTKVGLAKLPEEEKDSSKSKGK